MLLVRVQYAEYIHVHNIILYKYMYMVVRVYSIVQASMQYHSFIPRFDPQFSALYMYITWE